MLIYMLIIQRINKLKKKTNIKINLKNYSKLNCSISNSFLNLWCTFVTISNYQHSSISTILIVIK